VASDSDLDISSAVTGMAGRNEIQRLTIGGTPNTGGVTTFTLTFDGQTTSAIAWDSDPSVTALAIQGALRGLSTVNGANVVVTAATATGVLPAFFDITFQGTLASFNQSTISVALVSAFGASGQTVLDPFPGNLGNFGKHGTGTLVMSGSATSTFTAITRVNEGIFRRRSPRPSALPRRLRPTRSSGSPSEARRPTPARPSL